MDLVRVELFFRVDRKFTTSKISICMLLVCKRIAKQARMLLKTLVIIGALTGLILGCIGTSVPWLFPQAFSPDAEVVKEVCSAKNLIFMLLTEEPTHYQSARTV